jgi:predicted dehydrogenase
MSQQNQPTQSGKRGNDQRETNRRDFLKTAALISASAWAVGRGAWADDSNPAASNSPNEKINIANIGIGGKGDSDSTHCAKFGNIVAICDIDDRRLDKKSKEKGFEKAERFNDFRKMFDQIGKSIDAVTVSIPDHNHAVAALAAMALGKHVYCQKPLVRTVREARLMREAANHYKVCTQMGNQGTATGELRRGVEILRAGVLGPVKEVHIWTNRPIWPQAPTVKSRPPEAPVPEGVHWNEWIGPAPMRPYAEYTEGNGKRKGAYHDFNWRGWWDFGTGALGDMGCHTCNMPYMGLELGYATSVQAECGDLNEETYPSWAKITYEFAARGDRPPVKLTWWEGHRKDSRDAAKRNLPDTSITKNFTMPDSGSLVIGEKARMYSLHDYGANDQIVFNADSDGITVHAPQILPRNKYGKDSVAKNEDEAHKAEWISAIKANDHTKALSNFDYATMLTEFLLLGNVAIRMSKDEEGKNRFVSKKLAWDGPNMKFTNEDGANQWLTREYRAGYKI